MASNPRLIDLTGQVFTCWTVLSKAGNHAKGAALWNCRCVCGTERVVSGGDLRSGKSAACGCVQSRVARGKSPALKNSRLYTCWKNMRQRCRSKSNPHYGGKGLTVCPEWDDFSVFREWALSHGYRDELTIERVDNDLGYSPDNCTWADRTRQSRHRSIVRLALDGTTYADIAEQHGVPTTVMNNRISSGGWSAAKAATTPLFCGREKRARNAAGQFLPKAKRTWRRGAAG